MGCRWRITHMGCTLITHASSCDIKFVIADQSLLKFVDVDNSSHMSEATCLEVESFRWLINWVCDMSHIQGPSAAQKAQSSMCHELESLYFYTSVQQVSSLWRVVYSRTRGVAQNARDPSLLMLGSVIEMSRTQVLNSRHVTCLTKRGVNPFLLVLALPCDMMHW